MNRLFILPLLFLAGECLAHPGHGAPLIHMHGADWTQLTWLIGVAAVSMLIGRFWK